MGSTTQDGRYLHIGPAVVSFGSGALEYVYGIEIRPSGTVVRAPGIETSAGPVDIRVTDRQLTIYVKDASVLADTVAAATGVASANISVVGSGRRLLPLSTDTSIDKGPASVSFTRDDGTACRYLIFRAAKVPMFEAVKHGKSQFAEYAYALESLDPANGTNSPWQFEEGALT
jgi:hypothetical protein